MQNNFDIWNGLKKEINLIKDKKINISEREIWFVSMWKNIWFEEDWKWKDFLRPVVIIKISGKTIFCISLTSKEKNDNFHFKIKENSFAILSQTKHLDIKRFKYKIWITWSLSFIKLKEKLKKFLF